MDISYFLVFVNKSIISKLLLFKRINILLSIIFPILYVFSDILFSFFNLLLFINVIESL